MKITRNLSSKSLKRKKVGGVCNAGNKRKPSCMKTRRGSSPAKNRWNSNPHGRSGSLFLVGPRH